MNTTDLDWSTTDRPGLVKEDTVELHIRGMPQNALGLYNVFDGLNKWRSDD